MITPLNILALVGAYLLGSVPSAVWIGQFFYGIDVREYGSGNSGATNTFRVLGKKAGIPVLLIDTLKGFAAVHISLLVSDQSFSSEMLINLQLALGIASLLGHVFPIFVGFRGGKGVATLLGIVLALHTPAALLSILVFLIVLLVTKYVSLSSIVASFSFPFITIVIYESTVSSLVIFSLFISIIVLVTHQKNIERLLRKQESKAKVFDKISRGITEKGQI